MKKFKATLFLLFLTITSTFGQAIVDTSNVVKKNLDGGAIALLKRDGKIYTVIAVLSIILIGIFLYLWRMDKKLTQLEKK